MAGEIVDVYQAGLDKHGKQKGFLMAYVLTIIYGVYLLAVGMNGNAKEFITDLEKEGGYVAWLVAIGVLVVLDDNPKTHKLAAPFLGLAIATFLVMNYQTISTNTQAVWNYFVNGNSGGNSNG